MNGSTEPDPADDLDDRPQLAGGADQPRDQDVQRRDRADRERQLPSAPERGRAGQVEEDAEHAGHGPGSVNRRPAPSSVSVTMRTTITSAGTITVARSKGSRSGPRSSHGTSARNSAPSPGSRTASTMNCCGTSSSSWSSGRSNHSGVGT